MLKTARCHGTTMGTTEWEHGTTTSGSFKGFQRFGNTMEYFSLVNWFKFASTCCFFGWKVTSTYMTYMFSSFVAANLLGNGGQHISYMDARRSRNGLQTTQTSDEMIWNVVSKVMGVPQSSSKSWTVMNDHDWVLKRPWWIQVPPWLRKPWNEATILNTQLYHINRNWQALHPSYKWINIWIKKWIHRVLLKKKKNSGKLSRTHPYPSRSSSRVLAAPSEARAASSPRAYCPTTPWAPPCRPGWTADPYGIWRSPENPHIWWIRRYARNMELAWYHRYVCIHVYLCIHIYIYICI